jgi:hypothetical protein
MQKTMTRTLMTMMMGALLMTGVLPAEAQRSSRVTRFERAEASRLVRRVAEQSAEFRRVMDRELDRSRLNETRAENRIFSQVRDLDRAIDRLRDRYDRSDRWNETRGDLEKVRSQAEDVETIMRRRRLNGRTDGAWAALCSDLNGLLRLYDLPAVGERVPFGRTRRVRDW